MLTTDPVEVFIWTLDVRPPPPTSHQEVHSKGAAASGLVIGKPNEKLLIGMTFCYLVNK